MRNLVPFLLFTAVLVCVHAISAQVIPIPNGDFEKLGGKEPGSPAQPAQWKLTGTALVSPFESSRVDGTPEPAKKSSALSLAESASLETSFKVTPVPENERKLSHWIGFVSLDFLPTAADTRTTVQFSLIDPGTGEVVVSQEAESGDGVIRIWLPLPETALTAEAETEFTIKITAVSGSSIIGSASACRLPNKPTKKLMGKANGHLGPDLLDCGALGFTALSVHGQRALSVIEVRKDSPAAKAGLAPGDVLVGVSGIPLPANDIAPGWNWFASSHESTLGRAIITATASKTPVRVTLLEKDGGTRELEISVPWEGEIASHITTIYADLIAHLERAQRDDGSWGNNPIRTSLAGLALLGTRDQKHAASLKRAADWIFGKYPDPTHFGNLGYWFAGHTSIFMAEYHFATGDPRALPWIERNLRYCAAGWHTSAWDTRALGHGPPHLPYGNKSLVAPTTHLMLADALVSKMGVETDLWKTVWPFVESAWSNPTEKNGHGALGYNKSYKDLGEFWSRSGLLLAALTVRDDRPEIRTALAKIMRERHPWIRNSHAYGEPGGALGLLGLAAHDQEILGEVTAAYRWMFALAWEPGYGLRFTTPHMGAPYMGTDELITAAYGVVLGAPKKSLLTFGAKDSGWLKLPADLPTPLSPATIRRNAEGKIVLAPRVPGAGIEIKYTTDGTDPTPASTTYRDPFDLPSGGTVKAIAVQMDKATPVSQRTFGVSKVGWKIVEASGHPDPATAIERAQFLIDDDLAIAWRSDVGKGAPTFPYHVIIDLGAKVDIGGVGHTCPSKNAAPAELTVSVVGDDNSTPILTTDFVEHATARIIPMIPTETRYLRLDFHRPFLDAGNSLIISELEIFPVIATPATTESRVLSYNIKHGQGMDGKLDLERTAETIREQSPDIVALQEIDNQCRRSGSVDQMAALGKMLDMHHAFGKSMDHDGGEYGVGIVSKYPILRSETHVLPDGGAEPRSALEVEVEIAGQRTSFVSVHLEWSKEEIRLAQAKALIEKLKARPHPVVLIGDFNATRDSKTLAILSKHWAALAKTGAPESSPADKPKSEIDFILVPKDSKWGKIESEVIDEPVTSDHRPVQATLPF